MNQERPAPSNGSGRFRHRTGGRFRMQTRSPGGPQLSNGHITHDPADVRQFPVLSFVAEDSRRNHHVLGTPSLRRFFFKSRLFSICPNGFAGAIGTRRMIGDYHRQQQNFVRLFIDSPNDHRTFFGYFRLVLVAKGHAPNFKQLRFSKPISYHHPSMRPALPPHRLLFSDEKDSDGLNLLSANASHQTEILRLR